jgi:hypothetical protein
MNRQVNAQRAYPDEAFKIKNEFQFNELSLAMLALASKSG